MTIHAYTETKGYATYPAYINIRESEETKGDTLITVRQRGEDVGSVIALTLDQLRKLVNDVSMHLDGEPQAPAPGAAHPGDSTMQPDQQRVVDESAELNERLDKLGQFFDTPIFNGLDGDEQWRLRRQHDAMSAYSTVLAERIAAFTTAASATV